MEESITIDTALGQMCFSARAGRCSVDDCELELRVVETERNLPPGMSVRRLRAVLLRACSPTGIEQLDFTCRLLTDIKGGGDPGEHLDAQSWEGEHDVVVVGTEDGEALQSRMPWLNLQLDPLGLVEYRIDGLNVPLTGIPAGVVVELHYVVAENGNPEPAERSAWFAVDIPHEQLRSKLQ